MRRLLKQRHYSLKSNRKRLEGGADHPDRDRQFEYIQAQKAVFQAKGGPVLSVDTKKKELIGNFKNAGQTWNQKASEVNVHDFPSQAEGRAVPYGIYEVSHNRGSLLLGDSADTPEFAVDAWVAWGESGGKDRYPPASPWLILADGGGSHGHRCRSWKKSLQEKVCDRLKVSVTVSHFPRGCSKWNPIEHRLFGPISLNWAGRPLITFERMVSLIQGTPTQTGLGVQAAQKRGLYQKGQKVSDAEMKALLLERHEVCPNWNYTLRPRSFAPSSPELIS